MWGRNAAYWEINGDPDGAWLTGADRQKGREWHTQRNRAAGIRQGGDGEWHTRGKRKAGESLMGQGPSEDPKSGGGVRHVFI